MVSDTFNLGVILTVFGLLGSIVCLPVKGEGGYTGLLVRESVSFITWRALGFLEFLFLSSLLLGLYLMVWRRGGDLDG
ncbi:MAG: hypothetical protein ACE5PM_06880 [Candidatus Hydrothermarchaeales archaeon]